jgi:hypothetical protein
MLGPTELTLLLVVAVIFTGFVFYYAYINLSYLEKKVDMMESILVDVRMSMDSLLAEDHHHPAPVPISTALPTAATFTPPQPLEPSEAEQIPEESFYSSVLEQAHEGGAEQVPAEAGTLSVEEALESFNDVAPVSAEAGGTDIQASSASVGPNYDAMTRNELIAAAEKRGLRAKKSSSRSELLNLLRRGDTLQNATSTAGTENVSGPTGTLFPNAASVDGDFPVDLGQVGGTLEVSA